MQVFWLVLNFFILSIVILLTTYFYHALIISSFGKFPPFVPSTGWQKKMIIDEVSKLLEEINDKTFTILDPGCGIGSLIIPLARKFPNHHFIGVEWSWYPYIIAKIRGKKIKNLKITHNDMFNESFGNTDIIICFLVKRLIKPITTKIINDIKCDCTIISNGLEFPDLNLIKEILCPSFFFKNKLYFYNLENLTKNKPVFSTLEKF